MYCENCGSELSDNSKFCPECGQPIAAKLEEQAASSQAVETSGAPQPPAGAPVNPQGTATPPPPAGAPVSGGAPVSPQKDDGPWYGKTWVIILFLIFLWPVGLVLMWLKTCHWKKYAKIIISVVCGLMLIMQIVSIATLFGGESVTISDPPYTSSSSNAKSSSSSAGKSSQPSSSSSASKTNVDPSYLTNGVPNVVAIINFSGSEMEKACKDAGMTWSSDKNWYRKSADGGAYAFMYTDAKKNNIPNTQWSSIKPFANYATPLKATLHVPGKSIIDASHQYIKGLEADASAVSPDEKESYLLFSGKAASVLVHVALLGDGTQVAFEVMNDAFFAEGAQPNFLKGDTASKAFDYFAQNYSKQGWRVAG